MTTSSRSTRSRNQAVLSSRASSSSVAAKNRDATTGRAAGSDEDDKDDEKSEATTGKSGSAQQGRRVIRLRTRSSQRGGGGAAATGVEENGDQAEMPSPPKDSEKDVTKEEQEKLEEEEIKLYERWAEEYYEIVEQLPLELHRTFALMKELETKMQSKIKFIASHTIAYRDARLSHKTMKEVGSDEDQTANAAGGRERNLLESAAGREEEEVAAVVVGESSDIVMPNYGTSSDADAEGEEYDEDVYHEAPVVMSTTTTTMPSSKGSQDAPSITKTSSPTRQVANKSNVAASTPKAARQSLLSGVARASSEAIRAAEEKVGLAVTAYDWVDRHIRRLDGDLQRSESSLLLGLRAGTEASRGVRDALGKREHHSGGGEGSGGSSTYNKRSNGANGWGGDDDSMMSGQSTPMISGLATSSRGKKDNGNSNSKKRKNNNEYVDASDANTSTTLLADMAIDPNEPKYCYCDQVSSGDMVACDNEDCPREWFHYHCVGLASPPKGRWYCLFCAPPGFKGSGTFPDNAPCLPPGYGGNKRSSHLGSGGGNGQSKKKKRKK